VHNPMRGGFDYYEAPDSNAINDDMPTPRYPSQLVTKLGVPASMAGRPLPPGAVQRGHGDLPKGSISTGQPGLWTGTKKSEIPSGLGEYISTARIDTQLLLGLALFAGAAVVGYHDMNMIAYDNSLPHHRWMLLAAFASVLVLPHVIERCSIQEAAL